MAQQKAQGTITITDLSEYYTFIRYSQYSDGHSYVENPTENTKYIGIYVGPLDAPPAYNADGWKWSLYQGRGVSSVVTKFINWATNTEANKPTISTQGWINNPPSYNSSKPYYYVWTRTNYNDGSTSLDNIYLDNSITDAIRIANNAIDTANNGIKEIYRVWYRTNTATAPQGPSTHVIETRDDVTQIWTKTKPIANSNNRYYFYCEETITNGGSSTWTDPVLDTSNLSQYEINTLTTKVKNFWWNNDGAHIASGINGADVDKNSSVSAYGFNSLVGLTGISFGYNDAKVIDLSTTPSPTSLKFYQPPTISGSTVTQGALAMNLSSTELTFFKPDASNTQALVINSDGVDVYGDTTGSGAALSGIKTAHFGSITTIGPTSYRHIQLSENNLYFKFSESVLGGINFSDTYRNEEDVFVYSLTRNSALNFTGSLNYNSDDYLKTGSFKITYVDTTGQTQTMSADNVDLSHSYTHTFSQTEQIPDTGIKLYQFIINFTGEWGEGLTSGDVVSPNFNLQIDSSDLATLELHITYSARIDGPHYIFGSGSQSIGENSLTTGKGTIALGDFQFVTGKYNESDKEAIFIIGNGSDDNNRSNVFVVDKEGNLRVNNGFQIYNNDETDSVAEFGAAIRLGKSNSSHFLMNANSLQAYNSSNQLYFEVSNAGIRFGNNLSSTVATQADVADASYSVEIQVTSIDYANNSATLVAIPYYQGSTILPTGVTLSYQWYKNGSALENTSTAPTIAGATTNTLQLGEGTDFGSSTTNAIYTCVIS